jgi:isopenicillin-N N-acyltransferase like protein
MDHIQSSAHEMPVLDLTGGPYERGLTHGRRFAREVAHNLATYLARFEAGGLRREAALVEAAHWWRAIEDSNASYAEEMAGIAAGSGTERNAIALLNARYELAFTLFGKEARASTPPFEEADGCTTFAAMPEVTKDGALWLGQNWDWLEGIAGRALVTRVRRNDGPDFVSVTEAGIVGGKMGLNACGIGLVENGLASDLDGCNPYRKPFHVRCREVVDAERFEDALRSVLQQERTCSANFVIAHADGEAVNLETSPNHVSYRYPRDGLMAHSNHFLDPGHGVSQMERLSPNTLYRAERTDRLLRRHIERLDVESMRAVASDHFGQPGSICRHADERQPPAKRTITVASVFLNIRDKVLHVANGPPCSFPHVAVPLYAGVA